MLTEVRELSSSEILERIRQGNKQAEQQMVEQYWRGLTFVLNSQCKDPDLVQDIAQETFIIVLNKARNGEIHNTNALASFIRQTGVNLVIAHFRKEKSRKTDAYSPFDFQFPSNDPDVYKRVTESQLLNVVEQTLAQLPMQRDRDLITKYFVENIEKQQLCDQFDITPAHFDRVLFRARQRLKDLLKQRLNADISQLSLAHLLSIPLLAILFAPVAENSTHYVRGTESKTHFANNDYRVKQEPHVTERTFSTLNKDVIWEQHNG